MMTADRNAVFGAAIRKLDRLADLSASDHDAIMALPFTFGDASPGAFIVSEGQETYRCCLLVSGYVCRHKVTSDGRRQIVSFHMPGDFLDLQHLLLPRADHNLQGITRTTLAWVPSEALRALARTRPAINDALWRDSLIDASIFREWVLNVGQRDAKSRIAHLLCEFAVRREAAGLGAPERFELPMTQEDIADATGLTPVHVNRMLQALGAEGVIERDRRDIVIADWRRMRAVAGFDPAYLHAAA
jgi:CRP-like cAMP-binding protein